MIKNDQSMKTVFLFILLLFMAISLSFAQHEHHGQPAKADTIPAKSDTAKHRHDTKKSTGMDHGTHDMEKMHSMPSHAYSRNLPMSRNVRELAGVLTQVPCTCGCSGEKQPIG